MVILYRDENNIVRYVSIVRYIYIECKRKLQFAQDIKRLYMCVCVCLLLNCCHLPFQITTHYVNWTISLYIPYIRFVHVASQVKSFRGQTQDSENTNSGYYIIIML